jgi:hypothetical protein
MPNLFYFNYYFWTGDREKEKSEGCNLSHYASLPTMLAGLFLLRFELHSICFTTVLCAWYSSPYASNFISFVFSLAHYQRESQSLRGYPHVLIVLRRFAPRVIRLTLQTSLRSFLASLIILL